MGKLSQCNGLSLHLEKLDTVLDKEANSIWVEANTSWADLLEVSLKTAQIPYVASL